MGTFSFFCSFSSAASTEHEGHWATPLQTSGTLIKYWTSASRDFFVHSDGRPCPAAFPLSARASSFLGAAKPGESPASFAAESSFASHAFLSRFRTLSCFQPTSNDASAAAQSMLLHVLLHAADEGGLLRLARGGSLARDVMEWRDFLGLPLVRPPRSFRLEVAAPMLARTR